AVVLGDAWTRRLFSLLMLVALGTLVWASVFTAWALLGLLMVPLAVRARQVVASGAQGMALIPVLKDTGLAELVYAAGLAVGLAIGAPGVLG
ncbi:MAG: 1,4-dihydroxy-2-naphthoate polyprenyltransferase, partial [Aeromicrobium sp.]